MSFVSWLVLICSFSHAAIFSPLQTHGVTQWYENIVLSTCFMSLLPFL